MTPTAHRIRHTPHMHPLLIAAARRETGPIPIDREPDWDSLIDEARRHGLLPLLEPLIRGTAPPAVLTRLERLHYARLAVAVVQELETARIVRLLETERIESIAYKGQILSREAYGQIGMRESGDIDILVCPADVRRAAELLRHDGFIFSLELTEREWERVMRSESAWAMRKGQIYVDLHWQLFSKQTAFPFPTDDALEHARLTPVGDHQIPTLSYDHLTLFLAIHGAKHDWERLEWLASFAAIADHPEVDWKHVEHLARRYHGSRRLHHARALAQSLQQGEATTLAVRRGGRFDRWRDRAATAALTIFQPKLPDWRWIPLPRTLDWLYPLVRVLRLLIRTIT